MGHESVNNNCPIAKLRPTAVKPAHKSRLITSNVSKYPSERDKPGNNALQWLQARRRDDNLGSNCWRVHNKLYDLTPFINKHPGGSDWIQMTTGTDITAAFEASHVLNFERVQKVLEKYYIRDADTTEVGSGAGSVYTFAPDGFYAVLRRRAEPVLAKVGTGPTNLVVMIQDTLALITLILAVAGVYLNSRLVQTFAGLVLGMTLISAHNFFHIKDNWRKYYFDLSCLSSYEWRISHALSHHLYTNTILDYELYMLEPFVELCPGVQRNFIQKYLMHPLMYVIYFFNFGFDLLKRGKNVATGVQILRPENLIVLVELGACIALSANSLEGVLAWAWIHSWASFYFGFVGLMAAHHHPTAFHEGDEARIDPDFGLCQLDATKTRAESFARNLLFILTTFGEHSLHHLFPTVCHSKLHHLEPVLKKTVLEFQELFPKLDAKQFLIGIHLQMLKEEPSLRH